MPAAPAPAFLCVTETLAGLKPGFLISAVNWDLRGILMAQGVEGQKWPSVVVTVAPGGSELTTQASLLPRVTVAHAVSPEDAATAARAVLKRASLANSLACVWG